MLSLVKYQVNTAALETHKNPMLIFADRVFEMHNSGYNITCVKHSDQEGGKSWI
jgi:hypothetical protein